MPVVERTTQPTLSAPQPRSVGAPCDGQRYRVTKSKISSPLPLVTAVAVLYTIHSRSTLSSMPAT